MSGNLSGGTFLIQYSFICIAFISRLHFLQTGRRLSNSSVPPLECALTCAISHTPSIFPLRDVIIIFVWHMGQGNSLKPFGTIVSHTSTVSVKPKNFLFNVPVSQYFFTFGGQVEKQLPIFRYVV